MKTISMSFDEYTNERQHLECEARKRGYTSAFNLFERMLKNEPIYPHEETTEFFQLQKLLSKLYTPLENNCK